jgi:hypothetical protein
MQLPSAPLLRRKHMNRRKFLTLAGVTTGYSVMVRVDTQGGDGLAGEHERIEGSFEAIAPTPSAAASRLPGEPHLAQADLACDLFVAGGGMAGVCAAIAAARHGARVLLCQDRSRLGGNSSSEVKMHIVGADMSGGRPGWRESGLVEELRLDEAATNPQRSREMWDLLLYDKVKSEPNITLLLDTVCCGAEVQSDKITRAFARCDKTEHLYRISAKLFADCTGDCRLGLEAGAEMRTGREAKSEFNESLALDKADDATLGSSILFTARDFGRPMPFKPPKWVRKINKETLRFRNTTSWEYGYWWVEWGGDLDTIRDNERIRFELLSISLGVWDYIKNSGAHPSSANWALDWLGMVPGKRGSRRMIGPHVLTEGDCLGKNGDPADGVCIGGWTLDDHPPRGFDRPDLKPNTVTPPPYPYNIPLRCLYSRNIANLFMAGRNISATHAAFTSTRVMATCAVLGQAVGTAAALCIRQNLQPRELSADPARILELRQVLLRDDQTIRRARNEDPLDLAREADVTASAELSDAPGEHVINGYIRDLPRKMDNRWAAPLTANGVWVQLNWAKPRKISHVQLTFDTGFHRPLTLTHQDSYNDKMVRGPQPETVRDYELIAIDTTGKLTSLAKVTGNYQRLNRHNLASTEMKSLRLLIKATNGSEIASVFEIRCYA